MGGAGYAGRRERRKLESEVCVEKSLSRNFLLLPPFLFTMNKIYDENESERVREPIENVCSTQASARSAKDEKRIWSFVFISFFFFFALLVRRLNKQYDMYSYRRSFFSEAKRRSERAKK